MRAVLSTVVMSFVAVGTRSVNIEIHGEIGTLAVPDPNRFDCEVQLRSLGEATWTTRPVSAGYLHDARGIGIADLALPPAGRAPRADGEMAYHVLDVMQTC